MPAIITATSWSHARGRITLPGCRSSLPASSASPPNGGCHATRISPKSMALVVLLRGVNVGGHRTFRPSVLAKELDRFGVVNIGAAGTFVVRKPIAKASLRTELARLLPFQTA